MDRGLLVVSIAPKGGIIPYRLDTIAKHVTTVLTKVVITRTKKDRLRAKHAPFLRTC